MLKALFALKIFSFFLEKQLDQKVMVNLKNYNVTDRETNNYNTHIAQYLEKYNVSTMQPDNVIWSLSRI